MSDPFLPRNAEQRLVREAKIGFSIVLLVVSSVGGWCYFQYTALRHQIPVHIQNAPIAKHVGPEDYLKHLESKNSIVDSSEPEKFVRPNVVDSHANEVVVPANRSADRLVSAESPSPAELMISASASTNRSVGNPKLVDNKAKAINAPKADPISFVPNPIQKSDARDISQSLVAQNKKQIENKISQLNPSNFVRRPITSENPPTIAGQYQIRSASRATADDAISDRNVHPAGYEQETDAENQFVPISNNNSDANDSSKDFPGAIAKSSRAKLPDDSKSSPQDSHGDFEIPNRLRQQIADESSPVRDDTPNLTKLDEEIAVEIVEAPEPKFEIVAKEQQKKSSVSDDIYLTKHGDSFWSIAQHKYLDGRYFRALFEYNHETIESFEEIPAGTSIKIPELDRLCKLYPKHCPQDGNGQVANVSLADKDSTQQYKTFDGDTLFDIARRTTGQASRYLELMHLNKKKLPKSITHLTPLPADIVLLLPE